MPLPPLRAQRLRLTARQRAERALERVAALPPLQLGRIFTALDPERILAAADAADARRAEGEALPLHGLTVSIKDLFDEAGEITGAGSVELLSGVPAVADAEVVRRLKAAGAVPFGRTTMSEFAYSGVGLNPHYGTCGNSRDPRRVPGGSTSGGAVGAALGLVEVALGSDTGGSVRVPAALNGLAGFKPSQAAVPLDGVFPLAGSYDSIGPLAGDIETCAEVHAVLSGTLGRVDREAGVRGLRIGLLGGFLLDGLDAAVAADFEAALGRLARAGAELLPAEARFLEAAGRCNRAIVASEAHAIHAGRMAALETSGDPRVLGRLRVAETLDRAEVEEACRLRAEAQGAWARLAAGFDLLVAPTVPCVAPLIHDVARDFDRLNALVLRNTSAINFADGCAATLPMQAAGALPTGLMVCAANGADWACLDAAARIALLVCPAEGHCATAM
ncbi:aspartyl-tRNA(Asn)/glutamyl-tRNA(Gln) amidotransferase subunit A [Tistlia consotensis]|uniref:Aspartyl-tRNA(Asn)/glutamyl-tRNA(Gln) amidotransferase subunit A n=1 Tax=Tistlia consotensis USBA 355 TaxID=560819 RepID=A0A1Y6CKL2_9PROT|nr:amidase family protein [Tistlia consotensis]SMF58771.1 aspartyl-tRNA(Asn)/glutamyl-tRNA(Gln) amidotransferase subunit A [Tistlia consotensis USBA 355]SNR63910.1 aspartyl-tRNA(Asn)/glutamyl-tRNA(Gln) amidotransferase subunit A [Tistlia consotensis]